jgi:hypothetical protein
VRKAQGWSRYVVEDDIEEATEKSAATVTLVNAYHEVPRGVSWTGRSHSPLADVSLSLAPLPYYFLSLNEY